jgi:hypothetical protein
VGTQPGLTVPRKESPNARTRSVQAHSAKRGNPTRPSAWPAYRHCSCGCRRTRETTVPDRCCRHCPLTGRRGPTRARSLLCSFTNVVSSRAGAVRLATRATRGFLHRVLGPSSARPRPDQGQRARDRRTPRRLTVLAPVRPLYGHFVRGSATRLGLVQSQSSPQRDLRPPLTAPTARAEGSLMNRFRVRATVAITLLSSFFAATRTATRVRRLRARA